MRITIYSLDRRSREQFCLTVVEQHVSGVMIMAEPPSDRNNSAPKSGPAVSDSTAAPRRSGCQAINGARDGWMRRVEPTIMQPRRDPYPMPFARPTGRQDHLLDPKMPRQITRAMYHVQHF